MTKYNHPQIDTTNNEVNVGSIYAYIENSVLFAIVKVIKDKSNKKALEFGLAVINCRYPEFKSGDTFIVRSNYMYTWRLQDCPR